MGWSCRQDAYNTMKQWEQHCREQTNSSNSYKVGEQSYFFEASRTEHADGAITGAAWKMLPNGRARKSGSFRIEGDGTVKRAPAGLVASMREHGFTNAAIEAEIVRDEIRKEYPR